MFYWCVESVLINAFACSYYHTTNENFVSRNINLVFRSAIIYNLIKYVLGISIDKGILVEQPTHSNIFKHT
jgi:hypothetical protein